MRQKQNTSFVFNEPEIHAENDLGPNRQQRESAEYICDMLLQLRNIAKAAKLSHVMGPLEYTYYEAFSVANYSKPPKDQVDWVKALEKAIDEPDQVPELPASLKDGTDDSLE